ncbi:MAG: alpha/beta hydrolase [Flavobacterium sp.]|nr:MAG: alpha/beta hydrolase [Flavobacterium sp.]
MKLSLRLVAVAIVFLSLTSCEKFEDPSWRTEIEASTMLDVAYGSDPKHKMDVYLPPNRTTNSGIIILVHGGSFIGGDKRELETQARYLAISGYAVLNINYRLVNSNGIYNNPRQRITSGVKVSDQVADVALAVNYALAHAKEWVVSSKRVAMVGHSAGATLSLLYAYNDVNNNKVKAVANLAGALDLVFTNVDNWESYPQYLFEAGLRFTGQEVSLESEVAYKNISPLYVANARKKIPTINVFPQNNDVAGLPKQDIRTFSAFTEKLNTFEIPNEFVYVAGADHVFSKREDWILILEKSLSFFSKNMD